MNLSVIKLFVKGQTNSADIFELYNRNVPIFRQFILPFENHENERPSDKQKFKRTFFCQMDIWPVATLVFICCLTKISQ